MNAEALQDFITKVSAIDASSDADAIVDGIHQLAAELEDALDG